jgi:hypothetical protein
MAEYGERIDGGWYHHSLHCYRSESGAVIPSVTGVFDALGLSDFSAINPEVLEWKRQFGTAVHRGVELLVQGELDWDTVDEPILPAVTGVEQWLKTVEYQPIAQEEKKIININGMLVGGTLDHRGSLIYKGKRRPAIIDLKTGSKYSATWTWQVGGYSAGAPKLTNDVYVGVALQVDKDGKVTPFWVETAKARQEFAILLASANLAVNARLAKFKNQEEG